MPEDDHRIRARVQSLAGLQQASDRRRHAEHRKEVVGDVADDDAFGALVGAQADEADVVRGEILEDRIASVVLVVEPRDVVGCLATLMGDRRERRGRWGRGPAAA